MNYVTYDNLVQTGLFIVALIGLIIQIAYKILIRKSNLQFLKKCVIIQT